MEIVSKYFSDFTDTQLAQFQQLGLLYREWNSQINVISRKDIDALYAKHVLHSLAIAAICTFRSGARVLDMGTGGGFPGLPLAIYFPEVEFVLADSIGKKIKVVQEVATAAHIANATVFHGRVETLTHQRFDFAISRAVAPLGTLWQWAQPLLRRGQASEELANGMICLKGGDLREEIMSSGLKAQAWDVYDIFPEPAFEQKYVIYMPM